MTNENVLILHPDYDFHKHYIINNKYEYLFDPKEFYIIVDSIRDDYNNYVDELQLHVDPVANLFSFLVVHIGAVYRLLNDYFSVLLISVDAVVDVVVGLPATSIAVSHNGIGVVLSLSFEANTFSNMLIPQERILTYFDSNFSRILHMAKTSVVRGKGKF